MGVKTKTDFDFWIEKLSFFFISFTKFILKYRVFLFLILGLIIVGFIVIAVKDNRDESLINSFNAELVGFLKKSPGTEQSDNLENLKKSPGIILDVVAAIEIENALTQNDLSLAYLAAMNHIEEASFLKIPRLLSAIELKRQEGSHMFFEHEDGRTTVIPNHPGEKIDRGLLNKIVKHDLQMTREEFLREC